MVRQAGEAKVGSGPGGVGPPCGPGLGEWRLAALDDADHATRFGEGGPAFVRVELTRAKGGVELVDILPRPGALRVYVQPEGAVTAR
jgi:hypothetical protein